MALEEKVKIINVYQWAPLLYVDVFFYNIFYEEMLKLSTVRLKKMLKLDSFALFRVYPKVLANGYLFLYMLIWGN